MAGKNRYPRRRSPDQLLEKRASVSHPSETCVFLSHRSADKPIARRIAAILAELGVDYYLDEDDVELQLAQKVGDDEAIVRCIEDGLAHSTHLLGLITPSTKGSWWVPFEIGAARAHAFCAHGEESGGRLAYIVDRAVTDLPPYMKVSTLLPADPDFEEWLQGLNLSTFLMGEGLIKRASAGRLPSTLAPQRRQLRFVR